MEVNVQYFCITCSQINYFCILRVKQWIATDPMQMLIQILKSVPRKCQKTYKILEITKSFILWNFILTIDATLFLTLSCLRLKPFNLSRKKFQISYYNSRPLYTQYIIFSPFETIYLGLTLFVKSRQPVFSAKLSCSPGVISV